MTRFTTLRPFRPRLSESQTTGRRRGGLALLVAGLTLAASLSGPALALSDLQTIPGDPPQAAQPGSPADPTDTQAPASQTPAPKAPAARRHRRRQRPPEERQGRRAR